MTARTAVGMGGLAVAAFGAWALLRGGPGPAAPAEPRPRASVAAPTPSPAPAPTSRRNVFRFADEERAEASGSATLGPPRSSGRDAALPSPEPAPRLVGLVRRGGRLVAALTTGSDVELAGPGEVAAGVVVVAIDDDGVRIRLPDGTETTLSPP